MTTSEPTTVTVPTDDGAMPAELFLPPSGGGPGLLVLHEIFGVSPYVRDRAADLAALGYVVVAPDLYWRLGEVVDESLSDEEYLRQGVDLTQRVDWPTTVRDAVAALDALRSRPEVTGGAGLVGFCFGGGVAFEVAAVADPDVVVAYYGSALPRLLDLAPRVTAPSLHHFGTADTYIPMPEVERIRDAVAGPDVEFELHDGAGHAFDNPRPLFHHPRAAEEAWEQTADFLRRRLPVEG